MVLQNILQNPSDTDSYTMELLPENLAILQLPLPAPKKKQ